MNDTRRDQLIEFVEREFIGPDPIDWEGMVQSNGQEILATDPPRTRYIAGILYPAETTDTEVELQDEECEQLDDIEFSEREIKPKKEERNNIELKFKPLAIFPTSETITSREKEVLTLAAKGANNKDIAEKLVLREVTVKSHLNSIFKKLNVTSRTQAVLLAMQLELIKN
jgi:ATP/maltotriose-dependent transcriptional regulator MalT